MLFRLAVVAFMILAQSLPSYSQMTDAPLQRASLDRLRVGFHNPPPQARLRCYWWWLNGHTDKPTITHDLEQMREKGFGGVILVDAGGAAQGGNHPVPAGPKFGSPAWTGLYLYALKVAERLGLEVTLNIQSGWNVGGPSVTPQDAAKLLTFDHLDIEGGHAQDLRVPIPPTVNNFYRDIAVLAYPLHHGTALAWESHHAKHRRQPQDQETPLQAYPAATRARAAAVEPGISMQNTDSMLDDSTQALLKNDPTYADALVNEVRVLHMQADGSVHVALPVGEWEILRVGYTDSGAKVSTSSDTWKGLAIDYMSRRAFNDYWNKNVQPLLVAAKPYNSLKYLATDSWEVGGTNWTDDFREEFLKRRGYDPVPYLPVVAGRILGNPSISTRFLTDLRRTVADLIVKNHYDLFAARAADFGLGVQSESGGPHVAPLDALETFRRSAVPQTEFWAQNAHRSADKQRFFVKEASSAADIYGRPYAAAEGETSIGPHWSESLSADLKPTFDMAVTEGLNRLVWHQFTSSPASEGIPGQEYFAGTYLNPNVTWWNAGGPFFDYLNRVQYMMQQGHAVRDVLYYYGNQVPNFVRLKADDPAHVLPGYDYDVTDQDALLHTIRIEGSDLVGPSGVRWRLLALPATRRVSVPVLELVKRYLQAGGAVVSLPPISPTGNVPAIDRNEFDMLDAQIWSNCKSGAHRYAEGTVYCTADSRWALQQMKLIPDVALASGDVRLAPNSTDTIDWVHRRVGATDVYFVRSAYGEQKRFSLYFRAKGSAELWDPVTGEFHRALSQTSGNRTKIDLQLPPYGTVFAVLPVTSTAPPVPVKVREEAVEGMWQLKMPDSAAVPLSGPNLWNQMHAFRYFSGTATYIANLRAPHLAADETACLHFSEVDNVAVFHVAGQDSSTVWTYPDQYCVQKFKSDRFTLFIDVTNLWHNQLVGDQLHPAGRTTHTNIVLPTTDYALLPSGLAGPAQWWIYSEK